jgi:hypothetical protein
MATVTLTWQPPTSGGPVENYKVYRKAGSGLTEADVKTGTLLTSSLSSSDRTFDDTTLSSGAGAHSYTVSAINAGGESAGAPPTTETL